eukprot:1905068-Pleurochrysis_carterae.AAC.1
MAACSRFSSSSQRSHSRQTDCSAARNPESSISYRLDAKHGKHELDFGELWRECDEVCANKITWNRHTTRMAVQSALKFAVQGALKLQALGLRSVFTFGLSAFETAEAQGIESQSQVVRRRLLLGDYVKSDSFLRRLR